MAVALRTPRLRMREWRDADREPFAAMSADPEVMRYLPPMPSRAASDAWIDRIRDHAARYGFAIWAVELAPELASAALAGESPPGQPEEARLIGAVGLLQVRFAAPFAPAVEVGWRLARRFWGRGYAVEAARAALDDGFGRLGLDEIVAFTVPANRRSWLLMERLGMRRDPAADFEHPALAKGDPLRRHVLYRLRRAAAP